MYDLYILILKEGLIFIELQLSKFEKIHTHTFFN